MEHNNATKLSHQTSDFVCVLHSNDFQILCLQTKIIARIKPCKTTILNAEKYVHFICHDLCLEITSKQETHTQFEIKWIDVNGKSFFFSLSLSQGKNEDFYILDLLYINDHYQDVWKQKKGTRFMGNSLNTGQYFLGRPTAVEN